MSKKVEVNINFPVFWVLAAVLTVFNLAGVISISWWWIVATVFAPILILLGLGVIVTAIGAITALLFGAVMGVASIWDFVSNHKRRRARDRRLKQIR